MDEADELRQAVVDIRAHIRAHQAREPRCVHISKYLEMACVLLLEKAAASEPVPLTQVELLARFKTAAHSETPVTVWLKDLSASTQISNITGYVSLDSITHLPSGPLLRFSGMNVTYSFPMRDYGESYLVYDRHLKGEVSNGEAQCGAVCTGCSRQGSDG